MYAFVVLAAYVCGKRIGGFVLKIYSVFGQIVYW